MADDISQEGDEHARFIEDELSQVKQKVPEVPYARLIAAVMDLVKVEIKLTPQKQINITCLFPAQYPDSALVVELSSKTLAHKLLNGLSSICESETKKYLGQPQVVHVVSFVKTFLDENPLCVCSDEIAYVKADLLTPGDGIKLRQKMSQLVLKLCQRKYFMGVVISVPNLYPSEQIGFPRRLTHSVEVMENNFPHFLKVNFQGQAMEIARQCVQPPLRRKPQDPPFVPKPSVRLVCEFLVRDCVKRYPIESCPICDKQILPSDPQEITNESGIERVYCGHLFHFSCLDTLMKTPPFAVGKFCPYDKKQIFHDKWRTAASVMEQRWAHKQARHRELEEVVDFLQ